MRGVDRMELNGFRCDFPEQTNTLPRTRNTSTATPLHKKSLIASGNNATNIGSHLSLAESNVYISTVSIPAYYTEQKQLERGSLKGILRKIIGIPFAIIYGLILYVIMRYMILSSPHDFPVFNTTSNFDLKGGLCSTNFSRDSRERNRSQKQWMEDENSHFSGDHKEELVYVTIFVTVAVGTTSVFSRNTRSTMLLILPGLITSRSRTFLFTFVLGLLCNGPISSIRYNFDAIMENAGCMYEFALRASCKNNEQLNTIFQNFKEVMEGFQRTMNGMNQIPGITVNFDMKIDPNMTLPLLDDLIKAPPMSELKAQFSKVLIQVSHILKYTHLTGKTLTIISIVLMVVDAVRYIGSYYSDSSFDNMFISHKVQKMWKEKGYKKLTPLRHWELNEGFKVKNSPKCTKREFYKTMRHGIPTFIFSFVTIMIVVTDVLLAESVRYIKEKDDISFSFSGLQNYSKGINLDLPAYNVTADACLSDPYYTPGNFYIVISIVLLGAGISCLLEIYMSRIRARMCDVFYPDKAMERADYLHYRINIGRINRKCQLLLIVRRELERRAKILRFSPLARLKHFFVRRKPDFKKRIFRCPACGWKAKYAKAARITFKLGESMVNDKICYDCNLDLLIDEDSLSKNFISSYDTSTKSPSRKKKLSAFGMFSSQKTNTDTL